MNSKLKIKNSKLVFVAAALLLTLATNASAQQSTKVPRIGFLMGSPSAAITARIDAFRRGLREFGYVEGKNIIIEWRSAEGKLDRLPALAAELLRLNVEVIVTGGSTSSVAAKEVTTAVPIVMAYDDDPVGSGFVASLARPGGNITGLSTLAPDISGKQLELLKEIVPKLSRVALFGTSTRSGNAQSLREVDLASAAFGLQIQYIDVLTPKDIGTAFQAARKGRAEAMLVLSSPVIFSERTTIADLAAKSRLPAIYPQSDYMDAGGLMFYGPSITDLFRRAAIYVDKILKGAKPADLPVEQPTKFDLVINLKTAKQIGLTIPQSVLYKADKVIK